MLYQRRREVAAVFSARIEADSQMILQMLSGIFGMALAFSLREGFPFVRFCGYHGT